MDMETVITTEYKKCLADNDVDLLQGRMLYSILDVIGHMKQCGISEEEILKLILRDIQQIVESHFEEES